jgi:hypothetical protein
MLADTSEGDYCMQTFVALDKWLQQAASEKETDALKAIKSAFENNIDANITSYEYLTTEAEKTGQSPIVAQNRLLAGLYRALK